jgi:hypothetical protein
MGVIMDAPFGSIEDWEKALLTLPEEAFFALVRSALGNFKTPFSKPRLIDDLKGFLSDEGNRAVIRAYLDGTDALIMRSIAALGNPTERELEDFIGGDLNEGAFTGGSGVKERLVNMEERLLVYRFKRDGMPRLALNPLLKPILGVYTAHIRGLFPCGRSAEPPPRFSVMDDRFIAAVISFALEKGAVFKSDGEMRKSVGDAAMALFHRNICDFLCGLQMLGIFRAGDADERLELDEEAVKRFGELSARERLEYCATGVYLYRTKTPSFHAREGAPSAGSNAFHQGRIKTIAAFLHQFLYFFDPSREYPSLTLRRLLFFLRHKGLGADWDKSASPPDLETLLPCLEALNILLPDGRSLWRINPAVYEKLRENEEAEHNAAVMDTPDSCLLYPNIRFADALFLALFSEVREAGAALRLEFTRDSVARGFDRGITADDMLSRLDALCGGRTGETLRYNVKDWESRYRAVSLYEGTVLCLEENRRYLAQTASFSRLINRTLAPGVYLLFPIEKEDALRALKNAGVDMVAQNSRAASRAEYSIAERCAVIGAGYGGAASFPALAPLFLSEENLPAEDAGADEPPQTEAARLYQEHFHTVLEEKGFSKAKQDWLAALIDKRLILTERQLDGNGAPYERLEARMLDQAGKISVIRDAMNLRADVEVRWLIPDRDTGGSVERRDSGSPANVEKVEGRHVLTLETQEKIIKIPLRKILYIRRLKKSIFE